MSSQEGLNFNDAGIEKLKYHYTFSDNKVLGHPVIFECEADDDVMAQEKFLNYISESGVDLSDSEIIRGAVKN